MTQNEILTVLKGCPDGATPAALALHGIDQSELDNLTRAGKVTARIFTLTSKLQIVRYFVKDEEEEDDDQNQN